MASSSTQHVVDIDQLSSSTEEKLLRLPPLSSERCIYSTPHRMRESNQQNFTPKIVSIGPIHYHNEKLRANQHLKERYLVDFRQHSGVSLKECYKLILDNERKLRNCYADVIELNNEDFAKMVLVDTAFLLMIFLYNSGVNLLSRADLVFEKPGMLYDIRYDMLLLENQLPFFILEELYKLSKLHYILDTLFTLEFSEEIAVTSLVHNFLFDWGIIKRKQPCSNAVHILDLLRRNLIPTDWTPEMKRSETKNLPSMKELHQAGVKIKVGSKKNMFDIRFRDGILSIPPLVIGDSTELVFQNLLAFELCHYPSGKQFFSDYFEMMRLLTLSVEDAELLIQNGVIDNGLPNVKGVTTLFHNISIGNFYWSKSCYVDVVKGLIEYYKVDWHRWKASAKHKYFKAPWAICSVIAAVFILVLTIVQTIFTILQFVLR